MSKVVGRNTEVKILEKALNNNASDLIAVYGRRRIGKTFLIREHYKKHIVFEIAGLSSGLMHDQLENFTKQINARKKKSAVKQPESWIQAFTLLERYLNRFTSTRKKVIFIDEFPWMATARSKFLTAFENFWNSYCTKRNDLIVVICGSSASYMVQKIVKNKRGLHNRITQKIRLLPFNLHETELFLKKQGIRYTRYDILQLYMAIGGVPHYLEKLEKGLSVAQNLDKLCFEKDGVLNDEFNLLYSSLFENSEKHLTIVKTLSASGKGLTRSAIIEKSKIPSGGDFSLKLDELIQSGFVSEHQYYQNKKQLSLYRLSDEYSRFYLKFIENTKNGGAGTWVRFHKKQSYVSWSGFAFETLCLKHVEQLKKALRVDAIYSTNSSWFNEHAQVDLLIDRDDNVMNLCEMKFSNAPYTIDKKDYLSIKNKVVQLDEHLNTRKNIFVTMVTTYGVNENKYSQELVQNTVTMDSLFEM